MNEPANPAGEISIEPVCDSDTMESSEGYEMNIPPPQRPLHRHERSTSYGEAHELNEQLQGLSATFNPFALIGNYDDAASVCSQSELQERFVFPLEDGWGNLVHYPPSEPSVTASQGHTHPDDASFVVPEPSHSVLGSGIECIKYLYSMGLLAFSVVIVMGAIFSEQTTATAESNVPPVVAFLVFWFLICWLAMMEGGQGALVGLQPIDPQLYQESHPRTHACVRLTHKGDNLERFIVGRQFLVVLVVFVLNMMASPIKKAQVFDLNEGLTEVFLASGVAVILTTIMLGQLTAQVNSANCMLDFVNNYFMIFTTYVSLAMEASGIMHAVYLVQIIFSWMTGTPIESNEPAPSLRQKTFFWARVLFSLGVFTFAMAVTLTALFNGKTAMWDGVPETVSVVIFFLLMAFVGLLEGMQIALFSVVNLPEDELKKHPRANKHCELTFRGQNLQAFLIGRQIMVTICMFVVARITTVDVDMDAGEDTIFGVSSGMQNFLNTGLLGAVITTLMASLAWRIIASSFPIAFLSNPFIYFIIRACLLLEKSGLCYAAWVLARYHKPIVGYQPDEVYLEGAPCHSFEAVTRRDKDIDRLATVGKYTYSLVLLVFAVVCVIAAMMTEQTTATEINNVHGIAAMLLFWFLIVWLALMEGAQGALVGLQPIEKDLYGNSHSKSFMNASLVHKGNNMERYIVGRQFLVVIAVFVANFLATGTNGASVLGLSSAANEIFITSGIAVIVITIMIGQLTAQVNSANCMLDFINSYLILVTTYISLAVEATGLLHSVYLCQMVFSKLTGKRLAVKEAPLGLWGNLMFWGRVVLSVYAFGIALAITLSALFNGKTAMWAGVPEYVSVILFFVLMVFVGILEGMQIAFFAVVNLPEEQVRSHRVAYSNCELAFRGQNLQAFLIGRQIMVTIFMFVVARISNINVNLDSGESTIFGVSETFQKFFNTGLLGAFITTIAGSLAWRVIASSFPLAFLSNPIINVIVRLCLFVEASGICSAAWILGRYNKLLFGYQPDEVYLENAERHGKVPVTRRDKDIDVTVTVLKYLYSSALLIFSVAVVMAAIFTEQTNVSESIHPAIAFFVFWGLILWLAMMEGGQGALVGLQLVDKTLYMNSHPRTLMNTKLVHSGANMERFILGRQFLTVLVVFGINMCGSAVDGASVLGLDEITSEMFLGVGVAMMLTTIMFGQLTAQINAANCMLDFINNYLMLFTSYVSLALEASGILHCVYLVQMMFTYFTKSKKEESGSTAPPSRGMIFWCKVMFSLALLGYSFAVTLAALFSGQTGMWDGVPEYASVIAFFVLMIFVGMMEGLQIALFAVVNLPEEELLNHKAASANCQLVFAGSNFQAFLIGRQILVTICMFVVARITSVDVDIDAGEDTIFGVSTGVQNFFNTGLLGALITTIFASLAWRIVASSFPVAFMSNPLVKVIIRACLLLEASGICSAAWLLALIHKQLVNYRIDDEYIGTAAERLEALKSEDDLELQVESEPASSSSTS